MGNFINNLLDNLLSTLWRVLDLPLYGIVLIMALIMLVCTLTIKKFFKKISSKKLLIINGILMIFLFILVVDKKINNIRKEVTYMNNKITDAMMVSPSSTAINKKLVYDIQPLKNAYPQAKIYEKPINEAIDLISIKMLEPNVVTFVSIIDLNHPNVSVKVSPEHKHKYLTSDFAKENNCVVAINGEAGLSMAMDCELGEWTGNWISDGKVVLMQDTEFRPFIGFSKNNIAHYSIESEVDTVMNDKKYNAIWGRFDILVNNEIIQHEHDNPYARTVMGTSADGGLLYLMIVDGKRPDYSEGLTYFNCAKILKELGASNAMACDQGGSSCMYLEPMGGIINRPADSDGIERPIYSHFGISMP